MNMNVKEPVYSENGLWDPSWAQASAFPEFITEWDGSNGYGYIQSARSALPFSHSWAGSRTRCEGKENSEAFQNDK